jgi:hypothetical protein
MALGGGADQVPVPGEEAERPVGAALLLEQPPEHGERTVGVPRAQSGAVVAADHEVGALAVADLVTDDPVDDGCIVLVGGLEAAAVLELDGQVGQRGEQVGERDLLLLLDLDHGQRGAVVVHLEPALGHLPEGDCEQPVEPAAALRDALLERHVGQPLHRGEAATDQRDRGAVAQPDRGPGGSGDEAVQHRAHRDAGSLGHGRTLPT